MLTLARRLVAVLSPRCPQACVQRSHPAGTILTVATVAAASLCTGILLPRASHAPTLAHILGEPGPAGGGRFQVTVVFKLEDCESNLQFLALFQRPRIRQSTHVTALLAADQRMLGDARRALRRWVPTVNVRWANPAAIRSLRSLGFQRTPFLLVLDPAGRLRLAAPAPSTPEAYVRLGTVLSLLVEGSEEW